MPSRTALRPRHWTGPAGWALTLAALLGCLFAGSYLKLLPTLGYEYEAFEKDPAFTYRLIEEILQKGRLPERDPLSLYPQGKETAKYLPMLLYDIAAGWVRALRWMLPEVSFQRALLWFNALSTTLLVIPVFVMTWKLTASRLAGIIAALFVSVAPFIVFRGSADNMRAEMLGVTAGFTAVMFWTLALARQDRRSAFVLASLAGTALYIALGIWRLNIVIFVIISVWHIFSLPSRQDGARAGWIYALLASGYFAAAVFQTYLRHHHAIISVESALALAGLMVCVPDWLRGRFPRMAELRRHPYFRPAAAVLIAVLAFVFSRFADRTVGSGAASTFKLAVRFWGFPIELTQNDQLYEAAPELWPYDDLSNWFGPPIFSAVAVLFFLAGAWKWPARYPLNDAVRFMKTYFWATAFLSFLVAVRNLMVFIPAACFFLGASAVAKLRNCSDPETYKARSWRPLRHLFLLFWCMMILGAVLIPVSLRMGFVKDRPTVEKGAFVNDFRRMLAYIDREVPENEPIVSSWMMGYNLQAYAKRPTLTDGLFEIPEMRRRVRMEFRVFSTMDEMEMVAYMKSFNARWLLIDRSYPLVAFQRAGNTGLPPDFILLHPERLKRLRVELRTRNLLLYRLAQ